MESSRTVEAREDPLSYFPRSKTPFESDRCWHKTETRTAPRTLRLSVADSVDGYEQINSISFHDSNGHEQSRESTEFTTSSSSPPPPVEHGVAAAAAGLIRSQRVGAGSQQMPTTAAALAASTKACAALPYLTGWRTVVTVEYGGDPY